MALSAWNCTAFILPNCYEKEGDESIVFHLLHELLYAQCAWLNLKDTPLFEEDFRKLKRGPTVAELYDAIKQGHMHQN